MENKNTDSPDAQDRLAANSEYKQTQKALARRAAELEVVAQVGIATATILNSAELLQTVVDLTLERFADLRTVNVGLLNEAGDTLYFGAGAGAFGRELALQKPIIPLNMTPSLVAESARTRQTIVVNDVLADPNYWAHPMLTTTRSELIIPLVIGDKLLGVVDVQSEITNRFGDEEVQIFTILATQMSIALENALRFEEIERFSVELEESRQFLDSIIENMPTPLFVKEAEELRIVRSNKANELLVGLDRANLLGRNDYDLFPKDEADLFVARDRHVLATGQPLDIPEQLLQTALGDIRILHTRKVPINDKDGTPKYILGISEDITERKWLEAKIQLSWEQRGQQVQISTEVAQEIAAAPALDELFRRVVHLVQERFDYYYVQVYTVEKDELVMQAGSGLIGGQLKEMGHRISLGREVSLIAQAAHDKEPVLVPDVQQDAKWLENPLLPETKAEIAVPIKLGDELLGVLDVQSSVVDGLTTEDQLVLVGLCGQIAIAIDYRRVDAKRREAETQLQAYTAELLRSNRELQEFAYVASHDLQEPLRKIQTFGDRLADKYQDVLDERGQDYLARMQQAAARMQTLIVDLLAFSRVTTETRPYALVSLATVVQNVLVDMETRLQETGAHITVQGLPTIEADATQMWQLFQNLISNAVKFQSVGVKPMIHIEGQVQSDGYCQVRVMDNGIGFSEQHHERIFRMFQRLHGRAEYEGTGVGLAVCRRIVERHHGRIEAASKPEQGTTFIITLPIRQPRTRLSS